MPKYKKCFDCDFMETKCYGDYAVISVCNKYGCCTNPEYTCRNHKKHNHRNYEPELYASSAGRTQSGATSPPFVRHADVNGPRQPKTERGPHFVMPSNLTKMDPDLALSPSKE